MAPVIVLHGMLVCCCRVCVVIVGCVFVVVGRVGVLLFVCTWRVNRCASEYVSRKSNTHPTPTVPEHTPTCMHPPPPHPHAPTFALTHQPHPHAPTLMHPPSRTHPHAIHTHRINGTVWLFLKMVDPGNAWGSTAPITQDGMVTPRTRWNGLWYNITATVPKCATTFCRMPTVVRGCCGCILWVCNVCGYSVYVGYQHIPLV